LTYFVFVFQTSTNAKVSFVVVGMFSAPYVKLHFIIYSTWGIGLYINRRIQFCSVVCWNVRVVLCGPLSVQHSYSSLEDQFIYVV